jgi:predicted type IV restriction endonuclease
MHLIFIIFFLKIYDQFVSCSNTITPESTQVTIVANTSEPEYRPLINTQVSCEETKVKGLYLLKFHWPNSKRPNQRGRKSIEEEQNELQNTVDDTKPNGKKQSHELAIIRLLPIENKSQQVKKAKTRKPPFIIPTFFEQGIK